MSTEASQHPAITALDAIRGALGLGSAETPPRVAHRDMLSELPKSDFFRVLDEGSGDAGLLQNIVIARPEGKFSTFDEAKRFSRRHLEEMAETFDPEVHQPLFTFGHPQEGERASDRPTLGVITALRWNGFELAMDVAPVTDAGAENHRGAEAVAKGAKQLSIGASPAHPSFQGRAVLDHVAALTSETAGIAALPGLHKYPKMQPRGTAAAVAAPRSAVADEVPDNLPQTKPAAVIWRSADSHRQTPEGGHDMPSPPDPTPQLRELLAAVEKLAANQAEITARFDAAETRQAKDRETQETAQAAAAKADNERREADYSLRCGTLLRRMATIGMPKAAAESMLEAIAGPYEQRVADLERLEVQARERLFPSPSAPTVSSAVPPENPQLRAVRQRYKGRVPEQRLTAEAEVIAATRSMPPGESLLALREAVTDGYRDQLNRGAA